MARTELMTILDGRAVTDLVPPHAGEATRDYAIRATGELMVLYLSRDADDAGRPV
ncbi:hypothetical protein G3T14_11610 [Methylobacterium sp. BTF04]|uniref:hypothetical protein n=1 Tax=Methylobacterium sp. BTF04 TaxID=2708300 RepID=UPI0013D5584D|nr:hypothetical protein [Methylobacterium sp. BTF04]NEU12778.1 hypothetical protein [Methylobacterium sp. BTF04]